MDQIVALPTPTSAPVLRDYQIAMIAGARTARFETKGNVLLVAPTGAGKTVVFSELTRSAVSKKRRVWILAHRRELIKQAASKLAACGVAYGIIAPGNPRTSDAVQVGSVQTVVRRLGAADLLPPDLIIVDEAHHSVAGAWKAIIDAYPDAMVLGVTASPARLDGRGLGRKAGGCFDAIVLGPTIKSLVDLGYLVPSRVFAPPSGPDLTGVKKLAGDYRVGQLSAAMSKPGITGDAVAHYARLAPGLPALAFCVSVEHAETVAVAFRAAGWRAVSVSGKTSDTKRDAALAGLADGSVQVLCTCDLISEGLDVPGIGCCILLRPTASLVLHVQQIGRGLRPDDGKTALIVLDHAGNTMKHGLPTTVHEWTLDGRMKRQKSAIAVAQCPSCYAMHAPAPKCPECGHVYIAKPGTVRKLRQQDGELIEITSRPVMSDERRDALRTLPLTDLIAGARKKGDLDDIGKARGFKAGWAWHEWSKKKDGWKFITPKKTDSQKELAA